MGGFDVSYLGAATAGLLSFLSPCVLPLVPPYLCFIGGVTLDQIADEETEDKTAQRQVLRSAFAFVLGFTTVFVMLGATASYVGQFVSDHLDTLAQIAGAIIIVLGLHFLGVFKIGFLYREARAHVDSKPAGLLGAYIIGLAFAFGWTPCVGPVLAAILMIAGSESSVAYGSSLLAVYALGIGIPFLLAAFAVRPFMSFMKRFRRHLGTVEKVMGGLLVGTGILFITGSVNDIGFWLQEMFPALGRIG